MDLSKLISYDSWANKRVFEELKKVSESGIYSQALDMFSHLLAAQVIWISRIQETNPRLEIWPKLSIDEIERLMDENPEMLKELISHSSEVVRYSNSKGVEFHNTVEEIIMHLTIHGQHHRAQIAKLIRQAGHNPPGTDFIFFLREK